MTDWSAGTEPDPRARKRFAAPPDRVPLGLELSTAGRPAPMIEHFRTDLVAGTLGVCGRIRGEESVSIPAPYPSIRADGDLNLALEGGAKINELMFTARPGWIVRIRALGQEMAVALNRIGRVRKGRGLSFAGRSGSHTRAPGRGATTTSRAAPADPDAAWAYAVIVGATLYSGDARSCTTSCGRATSAGARTV